MYKILFWGEKPNEEYGTNAFHAVKNNFFELSLWGQKLDFSKRTLILIQKNYFLIFFLKFNFLAGKKHFLCKFDEFFKKMHKF